MAQTLTRTSRSFRGNNDVLNVVTAWISRVDVIGQVTENKAPYDFPDSEGGYQSQHIVAYAVKPNERPSYSNCSKVHWLTSWTWNFPGLSVSTPRFSAYSDVPHGFPGTRNAGVKKVADCAIARRRYGVRSGQFVRRYMKFRIVLYCLCTA